MTAGARQGSSAAGCLALVLILGAVWYVFLRTPSSTPASQAPPAAATARPAGNATLLEFSGSGIKNSSPFTTTGQWTLFYTFDCSTFGDQGNFVVTVYTPDQTFVGIPVNALAAKGTDSSPEYDVGTFYLNVNSECSWAVRAVG